MVIKLIVNPAAGRVGKKAIARIREYLTEKGAAVDIFITSKRGDAALAAREALQSRADVVVAAGGDGTVSEVINGLAGSSVPLSVIPLGTVNVFALETGIPMEPLRACDLVFSGTQRRVNLGKVNDRYFILMAGVGFDAYVVYRSGPGLKRLSGRLSYVLTAVRRLFSYRGHPLEIKLHDGRGLEGYGVVVGNMKYYGGKLSVTPFADLERDVLDVCVFRRKGWANILRYTWGVLRGKHLTFPDVEYFTVEGLRVTSSGRTHIQADGDILGYLPAEFSIAKEMVSIILPRRSHERHL